jgi:hypothetical protein
MSTLRRLTTALLALGFAVLPPAVATPASAEPTPTPAPPCKADSLKMTTQSGIAVVDAPESGVSRSATIQNTTGYDYGDLTVAISIWPDNGTTGITPRMSYIGASGTSLPVTLRLAGPTRPGWGAGGLKVRSVLRIYLSFPADSVVTTYSTKLILTAGVCGSTVLAATSGMRFGFMTSGPASVSPKPSASAKASLKPTRKPSASAQAGEPSDEAVQPPPDGTQASEGSPVEGSDQDLASGDSKGDGGSPLPWLAGLGVAAVIGAGGLLFWLRRTSYEDEDED